MLGPILPPNMFTGHLPAPGSDEQWPSHDWTRAAHSALSKKKKDERASCSSSCLIMCRVQCVAHFQLLHVFPTLAVFAVFGHTPRRTSNFRRRHHLRILVVFEYVSDGRPVRSGRAFGTALLTLGADFVATVQVKTVPSSRVVFCATQERPPSTRRDSSRHPHYHDGNGTSPQCTSCMSARSST